MQRSPDEVEAGGSDRPAGPPPSGRWRGAGPTASYPMPFWLPASRSFAGMPQHHPGYRVSVGDCMALRALGVGHLGVDRLPALPSQAPLTVLLTAHRWFRASF